MNLPDPAAPAIRPVADEPIAVVGLAARFPGAPDLDGFWRLLTGGAHAVRPIPPDRWDTSATLDPTRDIQSVAALLDDVGQFDPQFFGISPREAVDIDPQQRLMLETTWRALEDAGVPAARLAGSRTGVYVGASWHDYEILRAARGLPASQHSLVGNALDVIAARVSYFLRLRGPSLTVETGCSSSLVALNLAVQALRAGEIAAALVGGVNLILAPDVSVGLTHFGGLSPTGHCHAFTAAADGFVRGEGVAALYVKTLSRAVADGDRVQALIVRTAVNNDGGGDSLVTPNPDGQRDLLESVYGDGRIPTDELVYVEAHGTGTGRGDPIEAGALGACLGARRTSGPLPIGSVKTNVGHLEAAAGMAGLCKVLLAIRHGQVPPGIHPEPLNPSIDFDRLNLTVVRDPLPIDLSGPAYLGVNSFGWGGTNAHVVVAGPPARVPAAGPTDDTSGIPPFLPLSARQPEALAEHARDVRRFVAAAPAALPDVIGTLAHRRDRFACRAALLRLDPPALDRDLDALAVGTAGEEVAGLDLVTGRAERTGGVAFVFPGQGSQWRGMGVDLYRSSPLFASVVDRCAHALRPHLDRDLSDFFRDGSDDEWLERIDLLQPMLWATALGLAELWRAAGIRPDVVLGHSQGEIAAATFAGKLSYPDAALIVARRSRIARRLSGQGLMLSVDLDRAGALAALEGFEEVVDLAVHNGPRSCVLSGDTDAVLALRELLEAGGTFCRLVNVDYASHSPQMDRLREPLTEALQPITPGPGDIEMISTVRVAPVDGADLGTDYWIENLRRPVLFSDALNRVLDGDITHVVEVSPHPVLSPAMEQLAAGRPARVTVLPTLRREAGAPGDMARAFARAYVTGLEPLAGIPRGAAVPVPGQPFRPVDLWPAASRGATGRRPGFDLRLVPAPGEPDTWCAELNPDVTQLPWLGDHRVGGAVVLPGTAILALAVNAAVDRTGTIPGRLSTVEFREKVALPDGSCALAARWRDNIAGGGTFDLLSRPVGATGWDRVASAVVVGTGLASPDGAADQRFPEEWADRETATGQDFYRACGERGLDYGAGFRCVRTIRTSAGHTEALADIALPEPAGSVRGYPVLHPALWDGALQAALAVAGGDRLVVPTAIRRVEFASTVDAAAPALRRAWSHAIVRPDGSVDVRVFDQERRPVLLMQGLHLREIDTTTGPAVEVDRLLRACWVPAADPLPTVQAPAPGSGAVLVVGDAGDVAATVADALGAAGVTVRRSPTGPAGPVGPDPTGCRAIVYVAPDATAGADIQQDRLADLAALVRACTGLRTALTVLTVRGAACPGPGSVDPGAAMYHGFTRVLRREHGELEAVVVDVDPADDGWADHCARVILGDRVEDQVALRDGRRLVARLTAGPVGDPADSTLPVPRTGFQPFRTRVARPGTVDGTAFVPAVRRPPGPGEVEIEVRAAGLNFIDVLKVMGTYPDPAGGADRLGGECAGRVTAVGGGVDAFQVGDRVVACVFGALASHVTVDADHVRPIPDHLADDVAAGLPLALCTAWYALVELAGVEPGKTVLVHSAAGGVGLAAVRLARQLGATVIATAGSAAKRDYLRSAGVSVVLDSRGVDWPAQVRAATGGAGVDVVVNSLTGAAVDWGLGLLAEDGHFIELGKRDIYAGHHIEPAAFTKAITFAAVDLAGMLTRRPRRFAEMFRRAWDTVTAGDVDPLPVRCHRFAELNTALLEFARGEHIGKFVIVDPASAAPIEAMPLPNGRLRPDGHYLISGGLGALGLSLADRLVALGARSLLLLGRSDPDQAAQEALSSMRAAGARIRIARCDVANGPAVEAALAELRAGGGPLRGVVHAAGVLDDATVDNVSLDQLRRVCRGKVHGARVLDRVTAGDPLDFFVLFSSAAALVGNVGQAAYAAANAALDALAHQRRRRGAPALSVQWGPFAEIGLAARDTGRGARLDDRGMGCFPAADAWRALPDLLDGGEPVVGYVPLDLRRWFDAYPDTAALPSWERLLARSRGAAPAEASTGPTSELAGLPAAQRAKAVSARIRELSGRVLRLDPGLIEAQTPFKELGLDSLMSLELRNRLEADFRLRLSPTLLWTYGNADALASAISDMLAEPDGGHRSTEPSTRSEQHV